MPLHASELILNADSSIYHLNLLPQDIADTIITVGDPDRVALVSSFFDQIDIKKGCREFITHTGRYKGKRISVISTGIGADNIDIVLNELDALVNVDFKTKKVKEKLHSLNIIRIGTSGSIRENIPVDSFLLSEKALGFDQTRLYYSDKNNSEFVSDFRAQTQLNELSPYLVQANPYLVSLFSSLDFYAGFTATFVGFYGPQGRKIRIESRYSKMIDSLQAYQHQNKKITNLEMETSAIYALSELLGHRAVSLNCILANRITGEFSKNPSESIQNLIEKTLDIIVTNL